MVAILGSFPPEDWTFHQGSERRTRAWLCALGDRYSGESKAALFRISETWRFLWKKFGPNITWKMCDFFLWRTWIKFRFHTYWYAEQIISQWTGFPDLLLHLIYDQFWTKSGCISLNCIIISMQQKTDLDHETEKNANLNWGRFSHWHRCSLALSIH